MFKKRTIDSFEKLTLSLSGMRNREEKDSLRSRAQKQCAEHLATDKALPSLSLEGKAFALNNYPIKAISRTD